jgi:F0F1-type ATP synthase assembly protein I
MRVERVGGDIGMVKNPPDSREVGSYFALAQIGLEMVAPIALGVYLDSTFGWGPWSVVTGAVLGLVGGLMHMVYLVKRFETKESVGRLPEIHKPERPKQEEDR